MDIDLTLAFEDSIKDFKISRSEKKELLDLIKENPLSDKRLMVLRSKIFGMAKSAIITEDSVDTAVEIVDWLNKATRILEKKNTNTDQVRVYFSPGIDCRNAINSQLKSAKKIIDICVFTITDNDIVEEIMNAKKRGVIVRVISDDDKSLDRGSDISRMAQVNIPVKLDQTNKHMHHKFMLIDKKTVLTGSYNWTRSAASSNEENIIILSNEGLCHRFQSEFDQLWAKF